MTKDWAACYNDVASKTGLFLPKREVMNVVTYAELFQFGLLIVGIIGLCLAHRKK